MLPFVTFRAPNHQRWNFHPKGRKIFRIVIWIKLPLQQDKMINEIITKAPCTISDIKPIIDENANELMDTLSNYLFEKWATFLLNVNESTTDDEIDQYVDSFPQSDYGFECYVWK